MPDTKVTCSCGVDRFMVSRGLNLFKLEDGRIRRSWASGEDDSQLIQCVGCGKNYTWNKKAQSYDLA